MSKLSKSIVSSPTGTRIPIATTMPHIFAEVGSDWSDMERFFAEEYRIGVSVYTRALLTKQEIHSATNPGGARRYVEESAKNAIIEEIFGEFRPLLREARLALNNRDVDAARTALNKLETVMFHE